MRADARDDRVSLSDTGNRSADVLVKTRRHPGFSAPIQFAVSGLPAGVVLAGQEWTDEGRIARLSLRETEGVQVAQGEYRIVVVGSAQDSGQVHTQATQAFFLRIEP
jgi:hypothetical protein